MAFLVVVSHTFFGTWPGAEGGDEKPLVVSLQKLTGDGRDGRLG